MSPTSHLVSLAELKNNNAEAAQPFTLDQFDYSNVDIVDRIFHHLNNTDFLGISVSFMNFLKHPRTYLTRYSFLSSCSTVYAKNLIIYFPRAIK